MSGASQSRRGVSNSTVWESGPSKRGGSLTDSLQGSGGAVRVLNGWCRSTRPNMKGLTGFLSQDDDVPGGGVGQLRVPLPARWFPGKELIQWAEEVSAGAEPSFVGGMTTDPRGVLAVRQRFLVRYGHELPCCNSYEYSSTRSVRPNTNERGCFVRVRFLRPPWRLCLMAESPAAAGGFLNGLNGFGSVVPPTETTLIFSAIT